MLTITDFERAISKEFNEMLKRENRKVVKGEFKSYRIDKIKSFYNAPNSQYQYDEKYEKILNFQNAKQFKHNAKQKALRKVRKLLHSHRFGYAGKEITSKNIGNYLKEINLSPSTFLNNIECITSYFNFDNESANNKHNYLLDMAVEEIPEWIKKSFENKVSGSELHPDFYITTDYKLKNYKFDCSEFIKELKNEVSLAFTSDELKKELYKNQAYSAALVVLEKQDLLLDEIPENFIDLYPRARRLNRKWKLHIGPTNSGKTYQSLERLRDVERGLYLAPLRLLALEVQERLLEQAVLCNLTTGEEEDLIENATHCSATVEKLDINKYYDVCVIDEAQMIADRDRGWAWTRAILGVCADEVHVCMSVDAKEIVCKLIEQCGEEYEIIYHYRNTSLVFEDNPFKYPDDIRKNDALVVFSRKSVLAVASELEALGKKVSILYGNLPYKVRKEELRKFRDGETDIIVTTDCIGMGMNVNVERIVFLQSSKFDGKERRFLNVSEVKQIAGRAGRMGMFEKGYVNALEDKKMLRKILNTDYMQIPTAKLEFPETLLSIDEKLSDTLVIWSHIPDKGVFEKSDTTRALLLCRYLEDFDFTKEQMLKFINIPFDDRNASLMAIWRELIKQYSNDIICVEKYLKNVDYSYGLEALESSYKELDLLFSFLKSIDSDDEELFNTVNQKKEEISSKLIIELKKRKNVFKSCKRCGRQIPWNHAYGICDKCYRSGRSFCYSGFEMFDEYYL